MTMVQKGCWTGPPTGQMQWNNKALPPDYSVVRGCRTDLCNSNLLTHDSLPNLSPGEREGGAGAGPPLGSSSGIPAPPPPVEPGRSPGAVRNPNRCACEF